ncbi:PAS domain S-box protein [Pseudomonas benzenivorans]|uniref:histidine kinase n=1 Tax=Pseudomonas benzenivorans TaxID=556533 RepID=A0ABY5H3U8_9PSED|nr:PAS domain S-box protein [Pseudomonas benzenivorans]UTW06122.1 PAS domain S-box protein [Pseudomonas benzenivorans]
MSPAPKARALYWIVGIGSLILALLFSAFGWQAQQARDALWQRQMARQGEMQRLAQLNSQDSLRKQAQMLAEAMAADAWVVELVRQAHALAEGPGDGEARGYIRGQLFSRLAPRWRRLQAGHPFRLSVHLAPAAEVLLRVHEPERFGESQPPAWTMLRDALVDGRSRAGLLLMPGELGMAAVAPLQVEGRGAPLTVGAIEVNLGLLDDPQRLDQELQAGVALLAHRSLLQAPDSGEQLRGLTPPTAHWHLLETSRPQVRHWQERLLLPDPAAGTTLKLISDQGRTYLLNQIVLPGYQHRANAPALAMALVWRDVSEQLAAHQREQHWLFGKWLLAWLGAEALLLVLLLATRNSTQSLMRSHQLALQQRHQQSEQSRQLLTIVSQAQAAYIDAQNQYQVFDSLLQRILELSASQFAFIGEVLGDDDGAPYLRTCAISGLAGEPDSQRQPSQGLEIRDRHSLFGQVLGSAQPLIVDQAPPGSAPSGLPLAHPPVRACAALPIFSRGQLVGLLGLVNRGGGYPRELIEQLHPLLATLGQLFDALRRDNQREYQQERLQRQQDALRALNEIAALPERSSQEQLREALRLGASFYQLPLAIISQVEGEDYRVLVQVSPPGSLSDGQCFPLGDTYCSITLASDEVLAIEHMARSTHASHPCYRQFALETYIGIAIWVGGRRFGTLNFSAAEPREQPFDEADLEFLRLFARWVDTTLERQQQEQARQALLERLDESQQIARLGHWELDLRNSELRWSGVIFDIFGRDPRHFTPSLAAFYQSVHPEDRALVEASQRAAEAGGAHDVVHRVIRPDGEIRWVHELGRLQPNEQGQLLRLVGTVQDISDSKQRDLEIHQARSFLQALLDSATGVSVIATDPDGLITLFNSGAERLLGYRAAEMIGRSSPTVFHRADEVRQRGETLSKIAGQPVEGFEVFVHNPRRGAAETRQWTYVRKDGQTRTVNLTVSAIRDGRGGISGFLGIASDISDLQQVTRALQKSESRFRGLVSSLPGVVYRCDTDAEWTMRYMSEEVVALCGYPASDFVDNHLRSYTSVIHPDDLPSTYRIIEAVTRQEAFERTYRLLHADGHSVWVREKGRGEYDSQGKLLWISGFIWDISERKAVEDQLKLSQQRFSSAFSTAPQGMALVSPQGHWLEVNDQLCHMLGYSREELLRTDFQHITHPDDLQLDLQNVEDLLLGRINAYQMEKRYLNKRGGTVWALLSVSLVRDAQGRPVHFVSQIQDFSERIAAERALREREDYLRTLLENVLDAIVTIDQFGRIETFNRAAEQLFGYSLEQVAGRDVKLLMPEADHAADDGYLTRSRHNGEARLVGSVRELTGLRSNGEQFAIELAVSQISHQGEPRFIAVIRDISERKRIEKLKNDFVSTVSHELRTPLTAIAGSLGLINGGVLGEVPAAMGQMLKIAEGNSQRLSELINDLLDMEKLVAGKMHLELSEQPLMPLIGQALEQNQPYAQRFDVRLELLERADAARVRVDPQRLLQVLANLLSNAAKFSPPGQAVELRVQQRAGLLRVSVRDYGPGVPERFREHIFAKFSQADASDTRNKGGTGLGLAISKEFIEQMGGNIGFDSAEGQGATFWIELSEATPA